jgi:Flp pilus assembly protein TadG
MSKLYRRYWRHTFSRFSRVSILRQVARSVMADRRGLGTLEFAMTFAIFSLLMFGIVDVGRALWTLNGLHLGAQQAARYAAIKNPTACATSYNGTMQSFAADYGGTGIPGTVYTLTCPSCGFQVTASYSLALYVPFVAMRPTLNATACFPKLE